MSRKLTFGAALLAVLVGLWLLTPAPIDQLVVGDPDLRDGPDAWVDTQNETVASTIGIVPGAEQRIVWREPGKRTESVVVYIHGFSGTRQEIAPVPEQVAERLGANLFEVRLQGHGLETNRLLDVSAEHWINETAGALQVGAALGEKIILISTSTGGTLSLALLDSPYMVKVDSLVMVSPNIEPLDPKAKYLTWPAGPLLAKLITGGEHSWEPHNALQEKYWTTTVPIEANVEVMRLVNYVKNKLPATIEQNLLMIISPHDDVVSPNAARGAFAALDAPNKHLIEIDELSPASNHVIAGDILWPENNERIVSEIVRFVRSPADAATSLPAAAAVPE